MRLKQLRQGQTNANIFVFCVILYFDQDQDGHISAFWEFLYFDQDQDGYGEERGAGEEDGGEEERGASESQQFFLAKTFVNKR